MAAVRRRDLGAVPKPPRQTSGTSLRVKPRPALAKSLIVYSDPGWPRGAIHFLYMSEKDAKNSIDSAHPTPEAAKQLTEKEKKAVELGGLIEHEQGRKREDLEQQVKELTD